MTRVQSPVSLVLIALALGCTADMLFYAKSVGISVLLFTLLLLTALFGLSRMEEVRLAHRNLWLLVPALFFASMVFVHANPFLTFLNISALLVLLSLFVFFYAADHIERLGLLGYPLVLLLAGTHMLTQSVPIVSASVRTVSVRQAWFRLAVPLLRGLLIAMPVLWIFTALLTSADSIFSGYVTRLLNLLPDVPELFGRLVFIVATAWLITGGFTYALTRRRGRENNHARTHLPGTLTPDRIMGFIEGATVLVLVDLLFTAFAWVQCRFLLNGHYASMHYIDYRDYVRRGFGELLFASVLTMVMLLGLRWLARHETLTQVRIFNVLSTLMIALVMVMLVSAFQRMLVWEDVQFYVNTPTRIYVRAFILWLGLSFVWLCVTLWKWQDRFTIGLCVAVLGFLVTINIINPDADTAEYNLARYGTNQTDHLATGSLYQLSEDAVPVMVAALDGPLSEPERQQLRDDLAIRLESMERNTSWQSWQSFHLARWQAYDLLIKLRAAKKIR